MLAAKDGGAGSFLTAADEALMLMQHATSVDAKLSALEKAFAAAPKLLITAQEAIVIVLAMSAAALVQRFDDVVTDVELQLEKQVITALGKVVMPVDFDKYMQFHAQHKLFVGEFAPAAFNYAVRRPAHCPEGVLSIERSYGATPATFVAPPAQSFDDDGSDVSSASGDAPTPAAPPPADVPQPIATVVRQREATKPIYVALGATTRAALLGQQFLHGIVLHEFSDTALASANYQLVARSRQVC